MARKGTLGYRAEHARRVGNRRIERLNEVISNANVSQRIRSWAEAQKNTIVSAMEQTRSYSESGKRIKERNAEYISEAISRLQAATEKVMPTLTVNPTKKDERINAFTQNQMNMASLSDKNPAKEPSIYSKEEVAIFYKVTQEIWQRPGVDLEQRNEAILQYFNEERMMHGYKPITLKDLMQAVVSENEEQIRMQKIIDSRKRGEDEYDRMLRESQEQQNTSGRKGSPTSGISHAIIDAVTDALSEWLRLPNPLDI